MPITITSTSDRFADALDQGFCSVEADIYLVDGALLVAHNRRDVKPERTLEALYLDPLLARVRVKTAAVSTATALPSHCWWISRPTAYRHTNCWQKRWREYAEMLTVVRDGQVKPGAVTVVDLGGPADGSHRRR